MSAAGMYKEASEDLEKINPSKLSPRLLPDYYECYRHLYNELGAYTQDTFRRSIITVCLSLMETL